MLNSISREGHLSIILVKMMRDVEGLWGMWKLWSIEDKKHCLYLWAGTAQGDGIIGNSWVLCQVLAEIFEGENRFEVSWKYFKRLLRAGTLRLSELHWAAESLSWYWGWEFNLHFNLIVLLWCLEACIFLVQARAGEMAIFIYLANARKECRKE